MITISNMNDINIATFTKKKFNIKNNNQFIPFHHFNKLSLLFMNLFESNNNNLHLLVCKKMIG